MKKITVPLFQMGVLFIALIIILLAIFWLPQTAAWFAEEAPKWAYLQYPLLIGIYITVIPFMLGIYEGLKLSRIVQINQAFSLAAVTSLKKIKGYALTIAVVYLMGTIILMQMVDLSPGIFLLGIIIMLAALMLGLISGILEDLLRKALEIKEENDLTV